MLVFYGISTKTKVLGETESSELCMNCCESSIHRVVRERLYFTFFFIPIIPLSTRYTVECPCCTYARKLKKADAKRICNHVSSIEKDVALS